MPRDEAIYPGVACYLPMESLQPLISTDTPQQNPSPSNTFEGPTFNGSSSLSPLSSLSSLRPFPQPQPIASWALHTPFPIVTSAGPAEENDDDDFLNESYEAWAEEIEGYRRLMLWAEDVGNAY